MPKVYRFLMSATFDPPISPPKDMFPAMWEGLRAEFAAEPTAFGDVGGAMPAIIYPSKPRRLDGR